MILPVKSQHTAEKTTVLAFWEAMQSNDFTAAAQWLTDDFECHWPQSNERIIGRDNFIAINQAYPASGRWQFSVNHILADSDTVVTDVDITDGKIHAKAITFHLVKRGLIQQQTEYWPDSYDAPSWRAAWVTSLITLK